MKSLMDGSDEPEDYNTKLPQSFKDPSKLLHAYNKHVASARESSFPSKTKKARHEEDAMFGVSYSNP